MRVRVRALATDGTAQRLRHGLGEFRPYRWHGRPGWNPAAVLDGWRSTDRKTRACKCGAGVGEPCRTRTGKTMPRTTHTGR